MAAETEYEYDSKGRLVKVTRKTQADKERESKGCCGLIVIVFLIYIFMQAC